MNWTKKFPVKAPSTSGLPRTFASDQSKTPPAFHFDRPPSNSPTIPITLLHPIFGQFQDDCASYTPTREDHVFALAFLLAMSEFYENEDERAARARKLWKDYGVDMKPSKSGRNCTDGDIRWNDFVLAILEYKMELGSFGAEPLFQSGWYFVDITRKILAENPNIQFPCLLLYAFGEFLLMNSYKS
jgi:hypothetical protein